MMVGILFICLEVIYLLVTLPFLSAPPQHTCCLYEQLALCSYFKSTDIWTPMSSTLINEMGDPSDLGLVLHTEA